MYKRIQMIRKKFKLNQTEFGKLCGKTQGAITKYETGRVIPDEAFIKLICIKFNVNEEWLRTGKGDMFIETMDSMIENLAKNYNLSEIDVDIIKNYVQLSEDDRKKFVSIAKTLIKSTDIQNDVNFINQNNSSVREKICGNKTDDKLTIDEKVQLFRQELEAEEKETTFSASTGTNGM